MQKKMLFIVFVVLGWSTGLFAQEMPLPRYALPSEVSREGTEDASPPLGTVITTPPDVKVRTMAEWEELQALVVAWNGFSPILTEIVRAAREECKVIVCCNSQSSITSAKNYLTNQNVDINTNVEFVVATNNSIWIRDYGPGSIYANDVDSLLLVDWIYNRNRPLDNKIPEKIGQYLNLPVFSTSVAPYDLVNTGGNFMSDGMGNAFASKLIFINNDQIQNGECGIPNDVFGTSDHDEAEIDTIMKQFMGIRRYSKLDPLPFDCIHHIDMHIKLLDEETLLVGQYPEGTADGPQIEANLQYILSNLTSAFGTPYKVVRIPMPPQNGQFPDSGADYRTYANAVFVNKTVIVPFYEEQYDTTAQRVWEEAMPGYKIVGVNCNDIIPSLGAIHCITKEIGAPAPLRIVHQPLKEVIQGVNYPANYPVFATIQHREGIASATVWYTTDTTAAWSSVPMSIYNPSDTANVWTANMPRQDAGRYVYYYIEASANNGKTAVRPMPAPRGWWKFYIQGGVSASHEATNVEILDIYPNPASALTVVPMKALRAAKGSISLYNTLGQKIATIFEGQIPAGTSNYFLDASKFTSGTYFVELKTQNKVSVKKLVVR